MNRNKLRGYKIIRFSVTEMEQLGRDLSTCVQSFFRRLGRIEGIIAVEAELGAIAAYSVSRAIGKDVRLQIFTPEQFKDAGRLSIDADILKGNMIVLLLGQSESYLKTIEDLLMQAGAEILFTYRPPGLSFQGGKIHSTVAFAKALK